MRLYSQFAHQIVAELRVNPKQLLGHAPTGSTEFRQEGRKSWLVNMTKPQPTTLSTAAIARMSEAFSNGRYGQARQLLRGVLEKHGLTTKANLGPGDFQYEVAAINGSLGTHDWGGKITLTPTEHARMVEALKALGVGSEPSLGGRKGLSTFVHEEIHGMGGALSPYSYEHAGAWVEEVATETMAQVVMRRSFATKMGRYAYGTQTDAMIDVLCREFSLMPASAWSALETASRLYKSLSPHHRLETPNDVVRAFANSFNYRSFGAMSATDASQMRNHFESTLTRLGRDWDVSRKVS